MTGDGARQVSVALAALWQVTAAYAWTWSGWGTPVGQLAAETRTPATPAGYAFAIWAAIFALSLAYAAWQALPSRAADPLARRTGWWLTAVFLANGLWQTVVELGGRIGPLSVLVILSGLAAALVALWQAGRGERPDAFARWVVWPLCGLMAGWLTGAAFVNLASAAVAVGAVQRGGFGGTLVAVMFVLAAGGLAGAVFGATGSLWYAGAFAWALTAILVANLGANQLNLVAAAAAALMLVTVLGFAWRRWRAPA